MSNKGTTSNPHAKEQLRCEVSDTLKGGYCENPGTQRTMDGLLCKAHARHFGLEERIVCWEAILLHIELWTKAARGRGREDVVRLLKRERAEAFRSMGDRTSEVDMEFDWADETLHAELGRRWLKRLLERRGRDPEEWQDVLARCDELVRDRVARATPDDLERIRRCADALITEAERRAAAG